MANRRLPSALVNGFQNGNRSGHEYEITMPKPTSDCRATDRKHPWPMVRLGDVCGTINGIWKGLRKPFVHIGIIRSSNMTKNCEFSLDKTIYIDVEEKKYKQRKLLAGDIIVERSGGGPGQPVGRAVYFDLEDGEYSVSNFTSILRVKDANALNGKFLQLYLTSQYFQGATENIQSNTTGLHNLDFTAYLNFNVPLPPLPVQHEIVARLERELAAVEKMKKGFEALAETAKAEFKAELEETFLHLKSKLMLFGDACEFIRNGASIKQGKGMSGIPVTRIETLAGGRINPDRVGYANIYDPHLYNKYLLSEGDLLISHINSERYIGRMVMYRGEIEGPIIHGMNLLRARLLCSALVLPDYVELYFKTTAARKYILSVIKKAVNQVSVSATDFKNMPLSVPTMELQRQIVSHLSAAKARAEKLEAKAREGVAVCETMRKAILKEAFE